MREGSNPKIMAEPKIMREYYIRDKELSYVIGTVHIVLWFLQ